MRRLLQRYDNQSCRIAVEESKADGRRNSPGDERASLPLRHLSAYPEGHSARFRESGGGQIMSAHLFPFSRRELLKSGGALIVGFSLAGSAAQTAQAAARGDKAGPPDPLEVDSWIAIHADNTATLYFGKCELGQGN